MSGSRIFFYGYCPNICQNRHVDFLRCFYPLQRGFKIWNVLNVFWLHKGGKEAETGPFSMSKVQNWWVKLETYILHGNLKSRNMSEKMNSINFPQLTGSFSQFLDKLTLDQLDRKWILCIVISIIISSVILKKSFMLNRKTNFWLDHVCMIFLIPLLPCFLNEWQHEIKNQKDIVPWEIKLKSSFDLYLICHFLLCPRKLAENNPVQFYQFRLKTSK